MEEKSKSQLLMVQNDLRSLPLLELKEGYTIRSFRPGDEQFWEHIIIESFQGEFSFNKMMKEDTEYRPERVLFICLNGIPLATASAWYHSNWKREMGYLHMVGALPEYAGKGLGFQVILAALQQMVKEGRRTAVLNTDDFRIPAIKTYLKLGFVPKFADDDHEQRWKAIGRIIK